MTTERFLLGAEPLTTESIVKLAASEDSRIGFAEEALERFDRYQKIVEKSVATGQTYYGINTGFGLLADVTIEPDKIKDLQVNLVRSHACGVGAPVDAEVAKGLMIVKIHQFLTGHSGIRREVINKMSEFIDHNLMPFIPCKGSVGASGDLAPMAHMALALIGEGKVLCDGQWTKTSDALKKKGVEPLELSYKEGLSLINGTQFMTVLGSFAVERANQIARIADLGAAMSLDAMRGTTVAFDKRIHDIRNQGGQRTVADNLRRLLDPNRNEVAKSHENCGKVQDPYSFRCVPQVHGASRDAIAYCENVVNNELNSVTDNPLVFENGDIVSGGNFHGQPVALAMDFLKIAVAEFGSISERRIEKLTDPKMSGLPAFITKDSGLNSGYMIPHVVAAALVSENKVLCHPASIDSIPTSADKEDHVSMGPIAARQALEIIDNTEKVLAVELLAACQALDLLAPLKSSNIIEKSRGYLRTLSPYMGQDRSLHEDIERVADSIRHRQIFENINSDSGRG